MRKTPLPIWELLIIFFVLLTGGVLVFLWQNGKFGKFDRFNLVLATHPVTLVSLGKETATVVSFPDDLYVSEVVPNYGGYKISQVFRVGELDHRGGQVLSWAVSDILGVPVDGFIVQDSPDPKNLLAGKTDVSFLDRVRFALAFLQTRSDKVKNVDLGKVASPLLLADGSTAIFVDKEQLDGLLPGDFAEGRIADERLRVEVVNSTPASGLGSRAARVLTNLGATVVSVSSSGENLSNCEIRISAKNASKLTVTRLAQVYSCKIVTGSYESRADVTLVLGAK